MIYLSTNLKFLRKRRKKTQADISEALNIPRATLNGWEQGVSEPKLDRLILLADYFRFTLDAMIRKDLSRIPGDKLLAMEVQK